MSKENEGREFNLMEIVESTLPPLIQAKERYEDKSVCDWYGHLWEIGKHKQTPELVQEAVEHYDGAFPILKLVSKKLLTRELCQIAVRKCGRNLKFVPFEYIDYDLCLLAIKDDGSIITEVPEELRDFQLCHAAVCNDPIGFALLSVPRFLLQGDNGRILYDAAVRSNGMALKYIPRNQISEELVFLAVENPPKFWHDDFPIKYVPEKYITEKLIVASFDRAPDSLRCVPVKYIPQNFCFSLLRKSPKNISKITQMESMRWKPNST